MTQEQIEQAAKKYAAKVWQGGNREYASHKKHSEIDYLAGANSRQPEIDRLETLLRRVVKAWTDPVSERCKPYAEQMADVIHEIKDCLKIER